MDIVLRAEGLTKHYGGFSALEALTLEVGRGEVLGYLGPNGAGNTTTIRLLLGLIRPTAGRAEVFGADVTHHPAAVHTRLAYVPGEATLWPWLTGTETLHLLARIHGRTDEMYRRELLDRFDFDGSKKVRAYSKGNRQKINLIAAFATRADLLLALAGIAAAGARPGAGFTLGGEVLFATAVLAGAAQFLAIGALAGQLMPVRSQAAGLAAGVFGVTFMLRAIGDVAPAAHGLVYASPFGWIEQVRSLSDPHPLWLLPPAGLVTVLVLATVWLAGRRDLGASTLPDRDVAVAHTRLLGSHRLLAVRLTRTSTLSWLTAAAVSGLAYGSFARSAGNAFATSEAAARLSRDLAHQSRQSQGVRLYAGIIFLFAMLLLMGHVASALSALREEEADGHLDNLLARPVRRLDWLVTRISLVAVVAVSGGACAGLGFWASAGRTGLVLGELVQAGLNAAAPAVLLLGIGLLTLGVRPWWTAAAGYTLLAWSFLVDMVGSVLHLNRWLLDTSLLQHPALAPVTAVNWTVVLVYIVLAVLAGGVGALALARRDLQPH